MGKIKSFFTGAVFGGLAAGSAVLLLTPWSGEEWRKEMKTKGRSVSTALGQIKDDSIALKNDIVIGTKRSVPAVEQGTKDIKISIDRWRKETAPDLENLQRQIQELNDQMDKLEEETQKQPPSSD